MAQAIRASLLAKATTTALRCTPRSIIALSLDLLVGYTGLISFGHAAYFGIAAYATVAVVLTNTSMVLGALVLIGLPSPGTSQEDVGILRLTRAIAAQERLNCYRHYCPDVPAGAKPALTREFAQKIERKAPEPPAPGAMSLTSAALGWSVSWHWIFSCVLRFLC